jgi:glycosyltransferase involved in cell wall biosynthesis
VRRPRILINALSLSQGGGGHSYLVNLLRELDLDPHGFEFSVLAASEELAAVTRTERIGWEQVALPRLGNAARVPLRVAYEQTQLPRRARAFDLLYCPADVSPAFAATPTVVALRNLHIYDMRFYETFRLRMLQRMVQAGVRRARRILFPTRAAADRIAQRIEIDPDRIAIVPHGVSAEPFQAAVKAVRAAGDPPYLFLPASVERHKRIEVLIRSLLYVEDPSLQVWIAGTERLDPPYAAELRRLAQELGLASRVRFLGAIKYGEILHYYRGAMALAFPSHLETFGQPMLEAMLAETPIIAADIPTFREIAGDIALYFPPDDSVRLAAAADQVRRDPDAAKERVSRGRARAAEFSWKRSIDRLCGIFDEVLSERGAGATR